MKLVIHDLSAAEWAKIAPEYPDATVISDSGTIKPCIGCFGCWNRTPGQCVMPDGYDRMGELVHHADEVFIISRYTYGGFSGFVKNVIDRCLGYVLPHFEIVNGESHHQKRYDEDKPFTFIFYGQDLTEGEKQDARRYVAALCANFRSTVKDVIFRKRQEEEARSAGIGPVPEGKTVLLNASMRTANGNSAKLAKQLAKRLDRETETVNLAAHLGDLPGLMRELKDASVIVLCTPLYVDGLPSQLIRLMEAFRDGYEGDAKRIYVLANMGLFECRQLVNLFSAVRRWCVGMNFEYGGALGVAAGELAGVLMEMLPFGMWPLQEVADGMKRLAEAVNTGSAMEDVYAEMHHFPRWIYVAVANSGWKRMAKKNGIDPKELFRQL